MGLFGGDDKKGKPKYVMTPRGYVMVSSDDQQSQAGPGGPQITGVSKWKQKLGQVSNTRSKFWNSTVSSQRGRATVIKRRYH